VKLAPEPRAFPPLARILILMVHIRKAGGAELPVDAGSVHRRLVGMNEVPRCYLEASASMYSSPSPLAFILGAPSSREADFIEGV
jgi:hypothetical protein